MSTGPVGIPKKRASGFASDVANKRLTGQNWSQRPGREVLEAIRFDLGGVLCPLLIREYLW